MNYWLGGLKERANIHTSRATSTAVIRGSMCTLCAKI
jgi:hypothetical protein